jgi:hypothetical protein
MRSLPVSCAIVCGVGHVGRLHWCTDNYCFTKNGGIESSTMLDEVCSSLDQAQEAYLCDLTMSRKARSHSSRLVSNRQFDPILYYI